MKVVDSSYNPLEIPYNGKNEKMLSLQKFMTDKQKRNETNPMSSDVYRDQ